MVRYDSEWSIFFGNQCETVLWQLDPGCKEYRSTREIVRVWPIKVKRFVGASLRFSWSFAARNSVPSIQRRRPISQANAGHQAPMLAKITVIFFPINVSSSVAKKMVDLKLNKIYLRKRILKSVPFIVRHVSVGTLVLFSTNSNTTSYAVLGQTLMAIPSDISKSKSHTLFDCENVVCWQHFCLRKNGPQMDSKSSSKICHPNSNGAWKPVLPTFTFVIVIDQGFLRVPTLKVFCVQTFDQNACFFQRVKAAKFQGLDWMDELFGLVFLFLQFLDLRR